MPLSPWTSMRAGWRRLLGRFHPSRASLVYSGRYGLNLSGLPVDPRRGENILTALHLEGLVRRGDLYWPRAASARSLARVHDPEYLDEIVAPGGLTRVLGVEVSPANESRFLELQRLMAGGTTLSTRLALRLRHPVLHLGGGLHHAHRDRGHGFCALNDIAIAIAQAREAGLRGRILVIDLDLHDGDGTRALFAGDPTVYTFSIHNETWGEAEAVASTCLALGSGVDDNAYLAALKKHLPPVLEAVPPRLIYYLAGVDPAADDRLGDWQISPAGMLARDRFVLETIREAAGPVPVVTLLAGGYGNEAWRYSARFFGGLLAGKDVEPPTTRAVTFRRYRILSSLLRPQDLTEENPDDWNLSEEDILPGLGASSKKTHFLGYYSVHGIEVALERYGFLARLRALGYPRLFLDFELDNPAGQTMRIFGDEARTELLVEMRLRRDRLVAPGYDLLFAEWLLLQNPQREFSSKRRPLPGQKHPGLGMLQDVIALLVLVCERLNLDGLAFVPAHYHLAAQAEGSLHFLRPEDEALFQALLDLFAGTSLYEATTLVHAERVLDARSGEPVQWRMGPMVLPTSERLRDHLAATDFAEQVEKAREGLALELRRQPPPKAG